jgi:hypothetical protein
VIWLIEYESGEQRYAQGMFELMEHVVLNVQWINSIHEVKQVESLVTFEEDEGELSMPPEDIVSPQEERAITEAIQRGELTLYDFFDDVPQEKKGHVSHRNGSGPVHVSACCQTEGRHMWKDGYCRECRPA